MMDFIAIGASVIALCLAIIAMAVSRSAVVVQMRRDVRSLQHDVAQLGDDYEQLHALNHQRARRENVGRAREVRAAETKLDREVNHVLDLAAARPSGEVFGMRVESSGGAATVGDAAERSAAREVARKRGLL